MPPVLTSTNYDYDYDTVQPCFFLDGEEQDFYAPPQLLPGPGEDIWKKFELLPTPPLSPSRRPSLSAADRLEAVSDLLDQDCGPSAAFLQSFIIQDCMWSSSFAAATELERVVSERLASLRACRDSSTSTSTSTSTSSSMAGGAADRQVDRCPVNPGYLQDLHAAAAECIDPAEVFTTLGGKQSGSRAAMEAEPDVCLETPPLSSSDSESEEEEEEEEDEEIDVVTVDRRKASRRSDASPLVLKRSHINIHQHNYAARQPAVKRLKAESGGSSPRRGGGRRCWSPRSDGEDDDKRRTHNVLERQRRSELKISFLALRDEIPAVANNDKAAKVVILKKAAEFITEIREDERRLLTMKDELRKRSRELKHTLQQLRTLH
ncbi:transcriptional regulator Myc-like isoform X2 [Amphiprion ocellaris]|uniref:transcriptional regulator Myc-like isoform X2 n=1 Tax=Amphiprion ocellaris TaxID=80972 RepID=UPI0024112BEA|nr:transcriptional regulator Myc-like isoform X2 [Amphiprion ocellaris]